MGGADFKIQRTGGLLLVTLRGVATLDVLRSAREAIRVEIARKSAVKVLIDCRPAILLIGASQRKTMTEESLKAPVEAPVGYLVDPAHHQMVFEHCQASAEAGRTRVVFISPARAQAWAGLTETELAPIREFVPAAAPGARQP